MLFGNVQIMVSSSDVNDAENQPRSGSSSSTQQRGRRKNDDKGM